MVALDIRQRSESTMSPETDPEPERQDVSFASGESRCAAWIYLPSGTGPHPVVVMAHGFGAIRAGRLGAYAERFRDAGLAVVVFDYRGFGDSPGEPRQVLDIAAQLDDWRAALRFVRSSDAFDADRIGLWGSSFGGGHVMSIAAEDHDLRAVVAQVPFSGGTGSAAEADPVASAKLAVAALRDRRRRATGADPLYVPIVGPPGSTAIMTAPDALPGYEELHAGTGWRNEVAARIALEVLRYSPGATTDRIRCPLLVQVAEHDSVAPAAGARRAAGMAPLGEVTSYDLGHFDVYQGDPFEAVVAEQVTFFTGHLTGTHREVVERRPADAAPNGRRSRRTRYDLDGRTVAITGAGGGIGATLARRVAARGGHVAVLDVDEDAAASTAAAIGESARAWRCDVTSSDQLDEALTGAADHFGRLDVVVANAGITAFGPVEHLDPEAFQRVIDVNLTGVWRTFHAAVPLLRRCPGYLLALSSLGAFLHSPLQAHYVASKAGVAAMVDSLRVEVRADGIDVGAAFPQFVDSDMMRSSLADDAGNRLWGGFQDGQDAVGGRGRRGSARRHRAASQAHPRAAFALAGGPCAGSAGAPRRAGVLGQHGA
jgi:NAD(P)-dependent dehydrogenase (short-subunit alcohol dehydrogenase family)/pimeloyl-ACP methyl ester carboxylesterase